MNNHKVLILIPVYNGEAFISKAIDSCLNQTYTNVEVVVIENCSSDNTHAIAQSYSDQYENISVVSYSETVPIYGNWNRALDIMLQRDVDFVKILCADDTIEVKCVERCVEIFKSHQNVAIVSSYEKFYGDCSGTRGEQHFPLGAGILSGKSTISSLLSKGNWLGNPSGVMFRSSCVQTNFKEYKWVIDVDFWINLIKQGSNDIYIIPEFLYGTYRHSEQLTNSSELDGLKLKEEIALIKEHSKNNIYFIIKKHFRHVFKSIIKVF